MTDLTVKRGSSLQLMLALSHDDGSAADLSGMTLSSQVRDSHDRLVATLTVVPSGQLGVASILQPTADWPTGVLRIDFRISSGDGVVLISDTKTILVEGAVTRP
jgi:hypothetical protein